MTISIPTKINGSLTAWHQTVDGVKGYIVSTGPVQAFVTEEDADKLGRYFLFQEPVAEPAPVEPAVEPEPEE